MTGRKPLSERAPGNGRNCGKNLIKKAEFSDKWDIFLAMKQLRNSEGTFHKPARTVYFLNFQVIVSENEGKSAEQKERFDKDYGQPWSTICCTNSAYRQF
jgi:hypothetical protein